MAELQAMGPAGSTSCDYCGHTICDMDHILWQCPHFREVRVQTDVEPAVIDHKLLCKPVKRGIAPAMKSGADIAYWGLDLHRIDGASPVAKTLLGCKPAEDPDVNRGLGGQCRKEKTLGNTWQA